MQYIMLYITHTHTCTCTCIRTCTHIHVHVYVHVLQCILGKCKALLVMSIYLGNLLNSCIKTYTCMYMTTCT